MKEKEKYMPGARTRQLPARQRDSRKARYTEGRKAKSLRQELDKEKRG